MSNTKKAQLAQCPYCKAEMTEGYIRKYHGEKCKDNKIKSMIDTNSWQEEINTYLNLHEHLIDVIAKYYNLHVAFMKKPTINLAHELLKSVKELTKSCRDVRTHNRSLREELSKYKHDLEKAKKQYKEEQKNGLNNNTGTTE